ncbi:unnamed protein product [Oreochromis niloticus]|nr:unnamed protein product [Mustela putorius furo]
MHILVLVVGTVLLPTGCALKCYEWISAMPENMTEKKDCPSNTQCGSLRFIYYGGGEALTDGRIKKCALAEECGDASLNLGNTQAVFTSKCCVSDLCNTQDPPVGKIPSPNGKKCFQCVENDCTKTLNCGGNEDYCISVAVNAGRQNVTVKGCASKLICSNTQYAEIFGIIRPEISCCQGDLCNSGKTTTTTSQPSSKTAGTTISASSLTAGTTTTFPATAAEGPAAPAADARPANMADTETIKQASNVTREPISCVVLFRLLFQALDI